MTSPRRSANKVDLPAPLGPTNPIRSPRLTWSDASSKSARPAKDFESWETVSIAESAQCPLVRCPAQLVNHESTRMNTNHQMIFLRPGSTGRWPLALAASRRELSKKRIRENRARLIIHASDGVSFSGFHTKRSHRCQRVHIVTPLHDLAVLDGNDRDE